MRSTNTEQMEPQADQAKAKRKPNPKAPRQGAPLLALEERLGRCHEVALGLSLEQAKVEALRCLLCKDPKCIEACPLHIDIKAFIGALGDGDIEAAFQKISEQNPFPSILGRVCQHELYCEKACLVGKKLEPVAIGSLERFVADQHGQAAAAAEGQLDPPQGPRIALVGSGPASLIAAYDLARKGYRVTVFEALHALGGVLSYGIPNFRFADKPLVARVPKDGRVQLKVACRKRDKGRQSCHREQ